MRLVSMTESPTFLNLRATSWVILISYIRGTSLIHFSKITYLHSFSFPIYINLFVESHLS